MFLKVQPKDLEAFYRRYCSEKNFPYFTDISGPDLIEDFQDFKEELTNDAWSTSIHDEEQNLVGHLIFTDIQEELSLSNIDLFVFRECKNAFEIISKYLNFNLVSILKELKISRVQAMICADDFEKKSLFFDYGFKSEGILKEHFWHNGIFHDLEVLAFQLQNRAS